MTTTDVQVGDGATVRSGSDRYPATVLEVGRFKSGKKAGQPRRVVVQFDSYKITDPIGHGGYADPDTIERDPNGRKRVFTANVRTGRFSGVTFGVRGGYYDPSF